jgi:protein TonB
MNDRRRFALAIILGCCVNLLMLAAGDLCIRFSKQDLREIQAASVLQVILKKPIQENFSLPQITPQEIISNPEHFFSVQENIDVQSEILAETKYVLADSLKVNSEENDFSESTNSLENVPNNNSPSASFPSSSFIEAEKTKLSETIYALIEKEKQYPPIARRRNIEGNVAISITVSVDGNLQDSKILSSSNSTILDQAAINLIKNIFPLKTKLQSETELAITIAYSLIN